MKKYFVNGKQVSETEAILIDMENKRLQQSNNIADWAGIQFIIQRQEIMARAKYYIKRQMEGKEIDEVANFTRKDKAERFLNKLFKGLKEADRHYPYWVRQGYFKSEFVGLCVNFKTEYWIEKY